MTQPVYHLVSRWYHSIVPTNRRRYQITETAEVSRAIDEAAQRWPDESRARLLVRAIVTGGEALADQPGEAARQRALTRLGSNYADAYGPGYLSDLRTDWPE